MTTALEKCIREAVEKGGYQSDYEWHFLMVEGRKAYFTQWDGEDTEDFNVRLEVLFLDPLFWQALARARGWEGEVEMYLEDGEAIKVQSLLPKWNYHWYRFVGHLAEGKDTESFFASL